MTLTLFMHVRVLYLGTAGLVLLLAAVQHSHIVTLLCPWRQEHTAGHTRRLERDKGQKLTKHKHHTYAVSDITTSQMIISLETITNIIDKHREAHKRAIHLSVLPFVFSDLPQSCLVVGGPAGAQQLELPQGWGLVCGTEDRRTGWPRQNLRLTVPPENSHTVHHAPPSFLRSGRFSALRRSTNIIVLVSLKTIKET